MRPRYGWYRYGWGQGKYQGQGRCAQSCSGLGCRSAVHECTSGMAQAKTWKRVWRC